ncbi:MAG: hypothetical protein ACI9JN_002107 [Bacteroidia bacterium]|jgi:hypothetical protein
MIGRPVVFTTVPADYVLIIIDILNFHLKDFKHEQIRVNLSDGWRCWHH